jgi:hypothetical protein
METVEVKEKTKSKRIKRCYPRKEVYHRWVHSPEYVYSIGSNSPRCSASNEFLCINEHAAYSDIATAWEYYKNKVVAIIDREHKRVIFNMSYRYIISECIRAIPDDYDIFYSIGDIVSPTILFTGELETLVLTHVSYLVKSYIEANLTNAYKALISDTKVCHINIDKIYDSEYIARMYYRICYGNIKDFAKKYKLKQYSWYDKPLDFKCKCTYYEGYRERYITVYPKSLKKIINKQIFTKSEITIIKQKRFYTSYCYGHGISYNSVVKNWNKPFDKEYFRKYYRSKNWSIDVDNPTFKVWQDGIIALRETEWSYVRNLEAENVAKSDANYKEALALYEKTCSEISINEWREGIIPTNHTIPYRQYYPSCNKNRVGYWKENYLYPNRSKFSNVQLRLKDNVIQTSKAATVSIIDGINAWDFLHSVIKHCENLNKQRIDIPVNFRIHKIGLYGISKIHYGTKFTDNGEILDKKEWCMIVGCHKLWRDDIVNFINYYNLWNKFTDYYNYNTNTLNKL